MIEGPTSDDGLDVTRGREPPFLIPLAYATTVGNPLGPAARTLGLVCIVFGTLHLFIFTPLSVLITVQQWSQVSQTQRRSFVSLYIIALIISLVLSAVGIIAGIAAIRLRPGAVRALSAWGWCSVANILLGLIFSSWYILHNFSGTTATSTIVYWIVYSAERQFAFLTVPLMTLMLLRSHAFRNAYNSGENSIIARSIASPCEFKE